MKTILASSVRKVSKKQSPPAKDSRESLNMRIKPDVRLLIDDAADLLGKNRTDFVLDAAREKAQDVLINRTSIPINEKAYKAFVALLDAQPQPNKRLRKSLQTPAVWD